MVSRDPKKPFNPRQYFRWWVAGTGWMFGVLGLLLSIHFYYHPNTKTYPILVVDRNISTILRTKTLQDSDVKVMDRHGRLVSNDIGYISLYFYNRGSKPIFSGEILEPIRIVFQGDNFRILEARVERVSRELIDFQIDPVEVEDGARLDLSFAILERNDGAAIRVVYEGKLDSLPSALGVIVGAPTIPTVSSVHLEQKGLRLLTLPVFFFAAVALAIIVGWVLLYFEELFENLSESLLSKGKLRWSKLLARTARFTEGASILFFWGIILAGVLFCNWTSQVLVSVPNILLGLP